jgi:hypothetical protein
MKVGLSSPFKESPKLEYDTFIDILIIRADYSLYTRTIDKCHYPIIFFIVINTNWIL